MCIRDRYFGNRAVPAPDKEIIPAAGTPAFIYDAAMAYAQDGVPLIVIGGEDYGMGSSRDWAAKGTNLLGVKAVITKSFERIHRSNLIGMGVLPLNFADKADYDLSLIHILPERLQSGFHYEIRQGMG